MVTGPEQAPTEVRHSAPAFATAERGQFEELADNIPHLAHLHARDTSLVLVSRASLAKIRPFKARMGWIIPWYSSFGSDFNYDFHVTTDEAVARVEYNYQDKATLERKGESYHLSGEQPGLSVFLRDDNRIFHTYSTYGRGLDAPIGTGHERTA